MSQAKGTALITGASSGIGAVYADRLAKRGYDLILVARDGSRMTELAKRLTSETIVKVDILVADLTKKADLNKVEARLKSDASITLLLNNAGTASTTPLASSDLDQLESMIALNITALTRLSGAVVPAFVKRGGGIVVNISSIVALSPEMLNGTYSGTKAFVLNFTQSMHHELASSGIQVQAVLPGATATELWERSGFAISNLPKEIVMSAEDMVDASLVGLDRKELVTIPSLPDAKDWETLSQARVALAPNLSHAKPARRYMI